MSRYTVSWIDIAEDQLMDLWLGASSAHRRSITAAANRIDSLLGQDPFSNGSLESEDLYSIRVPPLKAFYEIDHPARLVSVTAVRWVPGPP